MKKPKTDVTWSPKRACQWPTEKNYCTRKKFYSKVNINNEFSPFYDLRGRNLMIVTISISLTLINIVLGCSFRCFVTLCCPRCGIPRTWFPVMVDSHWPSLTLRPIQIPWNSIANGSQWVWILITVSYKSFPLRSRCRTRSLSVRIYRKIELTFWHLIPASINNVNWR